jgi:hypothetical protein
MKKMWIFVFNSGFKQVNEDRLDFSYPHNPVDRVKFMIRKPDIWQYVPYGESYQECWDRATKWDMVEIKNLETELSKRRQAMFDKYGPGNTNGT